MVLAIKIRALVIICKFFSIDAHTWFCDMMEVYEILRRRATAMKAVKTHVGRCDSCGEPAAYAQLLPGGRTFRFCDQHVPLQIKKQAEAAEAANKKTK